MAYADHDHEPHLQPGPPPPAEGVPIVSAFFGIIIRMYFDDHNPPHFHAEHQGQDALVDFDGRILEGEIDSSTARKLIRQWARLRRSDPETNWNRAKQLKALLQIPPLE